MRSIRALVLITFVLVAMPLIAAQIGDELQLAETTSIEEILANPESYVGNRVQIVGEVGAVCQKMGCWMEVKSESGSTLRVKVEDGVLVFPLEAVGHSARVEGTLEILEMTRDEAIAWRRHLAEEQGEEFDDSEVGNGPYRQVQVRGLGAEIEGI